MNLLKERAKILAKPKEQETIKENFLDVLVFKLADERYGIETLFAKEVYPLKDCTPLPCAPSMIYGLINVRRKILTVIDLKVVFGISKPYEGDHKVVIIKEGEKEFGILSDGFEGIQKIPLNKIQASLPTLTGVRQDLLKGITLDKIAILDGNKLLVSKEIIIDEMVE